MKISHAMKPIYYLAFLAFLAWACSPVKNTAKTSATLAPISQDTTEYEVYINDIHFDQWFELNYSEAKDRTNEFYHSKNLVAAANWNDYYHSGRESMVIDSYINYEPQIDYGIEVNRKLYWYFKYVQDNYKIRLFW
jgi:hypothetical protein